MTHQFHTETLILAEVYYASDRFGGRQPRCRTDLLNRRSNLIRGNATRKQDPRE